MAESEKRKGGVENTFEKRRNCSLRAFSPFPTVFSKVLYCKRLKQYLVWERVNCLPDGEILDLSQLIASAGNKINLAQILYVAFEWGENIFGKGRKYWLSKLFSISFALRVVKIRNCLV